MKIPYLTRKSKFRIVILVIAVVCMLVALITTGCKQSEKAAVSEREKICSVEFFDTENLFLLERMEHRFVADGEKAAIELYTSAQVASDGQMGWDSGDQWSLLARQGEQVFLLYDEYVQYGEVQFWVSNHNPNEVDSPKPTDLESHIYVMVTTDVGFTLYDYIWDAENACFWKSVSLHPDNQWSTQHSNKYTFPASLGAATATAKLSVSDLNKILTALDLTEATLTYHGETDNTCNASAAIRVESYIEELKSFTWKEHAPTSEWNENDDYFYRVTTPDATITAFQGGYDSNRPLHLLTDDGEGWFILPHIENEQTSWMIYDVFQKWYHEAFTASLHSGANTPITAEEMNWFADYTATDRSYYDETRNLYIASASEISCFFTSYYDDVTELNFEEFMLYFPGDADNPSRTTDLEFEALKNVDGFPFTWVESYDKMPVPIHKYPRSRVDEVLTKYAGITTAELDTAGVAYLEEYDAFYNYTSDYSPGMFIPCYGERNGDIVTLWAAPAGYDSSTSMLTLQKSGENWHILSYNTVQN